MTLKPKIYQTEKIETAYAYLYHIISNTISYEA